MSDPRTAPYASARLADIAVDPGPPDDPREAAFHLVRRHFDVQAFGVNGTAGNAGDVLVWEHHERDDPENGTEGHEELFVVISGRATFTVDGEEIDASAGTLVFVRDPAILRGARATEDGTAILVVGGRPGAPYAVSRWEQALP
jgi:quercetin dioxygenase-like cupin family protein